MKNTLYLLPSLFVFLLFCFFLIPKLNIDELQESVYLGIICKQMSEGKVIIGNYDPFPENGLHISLFSPWLLLKSGSLYVLRFYHLIIFYFSFFLISYFSLKNSRIGFVSKIIISLIVLGIWLRLPEGARYACQVNGMFFGLLSMNIGLYFQIKGNCKLATFFFGVAAESKSQFLSFLFILLFCRIVLYFHKRYSWKAIGLIFRDYMLFFSYSWTAALIAYLFGYFKSFSLFLSFVFHKQIIIKNQCMGLLKSIFSSAHSNLSNVRDGIIKSEVAGFGMLTWLFVVFSILSAIVTISYILLKQRKDVFKQQNYTILLLSSFTGVFWLYYFFAYSHPYWYNTFTVIYFSFYSFYGCMIYFSERYLMNQKLSIVSLFTIFAIEWIYLIVYWSNQTMGNALTKFKWMHL